MNIREHLYNKSRNTLRSAALKAIIDTAYSEENTEKVHLGVLVFDVDGEVLLPSAPSYLAASGILTLNINPQAVQHFSCDIDYINITASFGGKISQLVIPVGLIEFITVHKPEAENCVREHFIPYLCKEEELETPEKPTLSVVK